MRRTRTCDESNGLLNVPDDTGSCFTAGCVLLSALLTKRLRASSPKSLASWVGCRRCGERGVRRDATRHPRVVVLRRPRNRVHLCEGYALSLRRPITNDYETCHSYCRQRVP